jgi:hypothetical protein
MTFIRTKRHQQSSPNRLRGNNLRRDSPGRVGVAVAAEGAVGSGVEDGATFFDLSKPDPARRGWYAFAPAEAGRYGATAEEAPG